jgi:hypothetical protein
MTILVRLSEINRRRGRAQVTLSMSYDSFIHLLADAQAGIASSPVKQREDLKRRRDYHDVADMAESQLRGAGCGPVGP